mgnify:CR=1 FL=1
MRLPQMPAGAAAPCPERKGLRQADESGNEKSRPDMGRDFLHCLDKGNPRLCRGRKRAYSEGRSRQEKVSKLE